MSSAPASRVSQPPVEPSAPEALRQHAPRVVVLLPCHNEAISIEKVVRDFRAVLPDATVHVCDNGSSDDTSARAQAAGATVSFERLPGKGNAVRRMFADIEADIYVLADGDDTYDHESAPAMIRRLCEQDLDMVVGARVASGAAAYRPGHRLGNYLLTKIVRLVFGDRITDLLSGYRVLSRRFVKSFPALAAGFEIETELTVHALELRMPLDELPTRYRERPPNSASKLKTFADGWRILKTIVWLVKEERPLAFFGLVFVALALGSLALAWPLLLTYFETGLVPRLPTAVLSSALMLLAFLSLACGAILDTVTRGRRELKRLHYLSVRAVNARSRHDDT